MYGTIAGQFYNETIHAIALMGSRARGEAQTYSDIDLVCLVKGDNAPDPDTHYIDGQLVVVSYVTVAQTETWFTDPRKAVEVIVNLQQAHILIDKQGHFAQLQQRARQFVWTQALQASANAYAGNELVGLIEEVHKGLNCLQHNHVGRLINANHGLIWGLTYVMLVYKGFLASGDNGLFEGVQDAVGYESAWAQSYRLAYGMSVPPPTLMERLVASLKLYQQTYAICRQDCTPQQAQLINHTITLIDDVLSSSAHPSTD